MQLSQVESPAVTGFRLVAGTSELARAALAPATRRAYLGALQRFTDWLGPRPLADDTLEAYLEHVHAEGRSSASASLILAALRAAARAQGHRLHLPRSEAALAGFRRTAAARGRGQAHGLQWHEADAMAATAEADGSLAGLRDAAIIAVMSDALLRVSELAALVCEDLTRADDGSAILTIRRSKTDPVGEGADLFLGPPTLDRLDRWTAAAAIKEGPLFRRIRRGGHPGSASLHPASVAGIVAGRSRDAGFDEAVRGHSLRVGSAQSLLLAGASLPEIQLDGRWSSSRMPARYTRHLAASRRGTARLRYSAAD